MFRYADSTVMKWLNVANASFAAINAPTPAQMYAALQLYYLNNGLYDAVSQSLQENGIWTEAMKGLKNPAFRVVEFYVSKIWAGKLPDALPILTDNDAIIDPIHKIWEWSNWSQKKQVFVRQFATFGDALGKVAVRNDDAGNPSRVYFQLILPLYMTEIENDERGYLTYIRLDIPQTEKTERGDRPYTYTEIWSKETQQMTVYKHDKSADTPVSRLGSPVEVVPFSDYGIDFVPFVHAKFIDTGEERGLGSFAHALDKIDELNRMATRLHQMLFRYNRPLFSVSANALDSSGRPLPPPRIGSENTGTESEDVITLGDDTFIRLPGLSKIDALVPPIDYASHLAAIEAQSAEIERDLPELAYYRLRDKGDISGVAVRLLLSDAIDRALEARGNAETALARLDAMALTIAQNVNLIKSVGSYEDGDFEHKFAERDVIPLTESEQYESINAAITAGIPLVTALRRAGWTDAEIAQMEKDKKKEEKERQNNLATALLENQRRFDQGQNPPGSPGSPPPEDENEDESAPPRPVG